MKNLLNFTTKTVSIIFGICICISIFGTVVNHDVALLLCENPSVPSLIFTYSLTFIGAIVITLGIISVFKLINKLSEKKLGVLAVILIAIYGGLSITNIILYPTTPNSDSYQVIAQALKMANGDTSVIDGSSPYFEDYSNNNAIVILLYYLFSAFKFLGNHNLLILSRVFNALFIVSAEILFYFGFIELTKKKSTAVKFLFLNAIFPSVPFISSWVYTVSICMPFMGGIFLCGAKLINSKTNKANVIYSIIIGILTVIGYKIRPVVAILSIAGFICLILWSIQDKKRFAKAFLSISLSAVVAIGTFFSISTMDSHYYTGSKKSFPLSHWVAMSLVGKGNYYAPVVKRHQNMKSTEEINDDSIKIIDNKLQNTPFHKLLLHQYKKHYYMWSDGSLGYKPRQIGSQTYHTIHKYTYGSKSFTLKMYCQMIWLSFHFLMLFCIYNLFKNKVSKKLCLPTITLLGAYLFYAIWEIKSNYAIPFVPFILILAAMGGTELENKLDCIRLSSRKIYKTTIATIGVAFIGILLSGTVLVTEMPVPANQEKIYNIDFKGQDIKNVSKHSRTIKQEFYVNSDFDVISVSVTNIHKSVGAKYKFVLKNSQNKIIRKTKIGFRPHNKGFLTIRLAEKYHPKNLEKFTLEIKGLGKPTDNYIFKSSTSPYIDCVKGNLYIDGNKVKQDMKIIVSETQNTPLLSKKSYFTLIAFIGIIELLIYYSLTKSKNI